MVSVLVSVSPLSASVEVAVTVRVKSAPLFAGGVMVRPASCAEVSVQAAAALVGAGGERRPGRDAGDRDRQRLGAVGVGQASEIDSAIALSSFPAAGAVESVGASATALTVRPATMTDGAVAPLGVGRRWRSRQSEVVVRYSPAARSSARRAGPRSASKMPPPCRCRRRDVAPVGNAAIVTASVSDPSVSVSAGEIDSAIALSSFPRCRRRREGRRIGDRVDGHQRRDAVDAVAPPASVAVAVTSRVKSASLLAGGVIVRPAS